jgi:hypothetical protein
MTAINVTDAYLLANFHKVINYSPISDDDETEKIEIKSFAGILAFHLIEMDKKLESSPPRFIEEDVIEVKVPILVDGKTDFSSPSFQESLTKVKTIFRSLSDASGKKHCLVKYEVTKDAVNQNEKVQALLYKAQKVLGHWAILLYPWRINEPVQRFWQRLFQGSCSGNQKNHQMLS